MKKILLTLILILGTTFFLKSQTKNPANSLLGTYMTEQNKAKVVINKNGDKFFGTLVWSQTPGKLDKENPDPQERLKPIAGKLILKNFVYKGNQLWEDGTIYDPESGKTYKCKINQKDNGDLKVRGFIGISIIGRTTIWKRVK